MIALALALALAPACGPPDLTFVSRRHRDVRTPAYNRSFDVSGDRVHSEYTDSWGTPRAREATLTAVGLQEIENGTRALHEGWDGPYDERCSDCLSYTAYEFEQVTILLRSPFPPEELEPLNNVVNALAGDVNTCDQASIFIRDCIILR